MTLHPILALDHVIEEYRDYLRTEFRAKDPALKEALERELDQPLFLAQEPFFQAHRPFRPGKRWDELPLDPRLARVMTERARRHGAARPEVAFLHQSDTIRNLLSPDPRPVVVTTGTGPGKTEAFLLPVIQNALEDAARYSRSGLSTILVYPMNALAPTTSSSASRSICRGQGSVAWCRWRSMIGARARRSARRCAATRRTSC